MLQTSYSYTSEAKTANIMARYRPIAPRTETSLASNEGDGSVSGSGSGPCPGLGSGSSPSSMQPTIRRVSYLRPTRTRNKSSSWLPYLRKPRALLQGLSPSVRIITMPASTTLVTLPLLHGSSLPPHCMQQHNVIDLNKVANIPVEKDFLSQLTKPSLKVFSPRPIRLVPSKVTILTIADYTSFFQNSKAVSIKAEEVEKELESQKYPGFLTDSKDRVRLVNSVYKKMVGQPKCSWLESMVTGDGDKIACKSICGKVGLDFKVSDKGWMSSGFSSSLAMIEWEVNEKKHMENAFCEVMKLECDSKDYKFAWRFHIKEASQAASKV